MTARADASSGQQAFPNPAAHRHRVRLQPRGRVGNAHVLLVFAFDCYGWLHAGGIGDRLDPRRLAEALLRAL